MAEIRDGTIKEVLKKLRRLSYEIEDFNRKLDSLDRTGGTLDDFRVKVDHYKAEMINLRRQVELGSAPLPPLNQLAGNDRFPIPIYFGERSTLSRFLKLFYTWALSSQSEDTLNHSRPVIMTEDNSRREFEREYGRQIVAQSLTVWNGLTKAVEKCIQGDGVHHAFVSGVVNTGIFYQNAMKYPPHVFLTRARAHKLRFIHILETTPILGAGLLHHHSQPPRRRTRMDRPFRPSHSRAPSPNRPPWRNLRHQANCAYRVKAL